MKARVSGVGSQARSSQIRGRLQPNRRRRSETILREAAGLLKSLRCIRALQVKRIEEDGAIGETDGGSERRFALLDGGATHALRQAESWELDGLTPVSVEHGSGVDDLVAVVRAAR